MNKIQQEPRQIKTPAVEGALPEKRQAQGNRRDFWLGVISFLFISAVTIVVGDRANIFPIDLYLLVGLTLGLIAWAYISKRHWIFYGILAVFGLGALSIMTVIIGYLVGCILGIAPCA